jgi:hypothetical protein
MALTAGRYRTATARLTIVTRGRRAMTPATDSRRLLSARGPRRVPAAILPRGRAPSASGAPALRQPPRRPRSALRGAPRWRKARYLTTAAYNHHHAGARRSVREDSDGAPQASRRTARKQCTAPTHTLPGRPEGSASHSRPPYYNEGSRHGTPLPYCNEGSRRWLDLALKTKGNCPCAEAEYVRGPSEGAPLKKASRPGS